MLKTLIAGALALVLISCAGQKVNLETQILAACQSFTDTLKAIEPFKQKLSESQIDTIRTSIAVARPICVEGDFTSPETALDLLRAKLRELVLIQNQMETAR